MRTAQDPSSAVWDSPLYEPPEPPKWPRMVARIVGTIGFLLVSVFTLMLALSLIAAVVDPQDVDGVPPDSYPFVTLWIVSGAILATGLLVAWWREGFGAVLILIGATLLVVATFGLALLTIFPAYLVGGLYLLSWALHRVDDTGDSGIDQISRWVRRMFDGNRRDRRPTF